MPTCASPPSATASAIETLRAAGVPAADLFIAVYPFATQEVNIVGALLAKQLGAAKVIALICCMLKSVLLFVTSAPISTKLLSSSKV